MKGISDVIATILMLMITIAMAGLAYMYISGMFTAQTQGIEVADQFCSGGTVTLTIRNIGTQAIVVNGITILQTAPSGDTASPGTCCAAAIGPGTTTTYTDTCTGSGGRSCTYRLTPPVGRTQEAISYCV